MAEMILVNLALPDRGAQSLATDAIQLRKGTTLSNPEFIAKEFAVPSFSSINPSKSSLSNLPQERYTSYKEAEYKV